MTIPKHPLHAQFDEILAEIFEVKDNWYFSKINFVFIFFIANFLRYFFIDFKDQGQICNLLVMRIPKLTLIIEIDKEMTELFKVKPRPNFQKDDKNMNWTSSVPFLRRHSVLQKQ